MIQLVAVDENGYAASEPVELPDNLVWVDEDWSAWSQHVDVGLTGEPLTQESTRGGRPITLAGAHQGNSAYGVVTRATVAALKQIEAANQIMGLTLPGEATSRQVKWRRHDGQPITFTPLWPHCPRGVIVLSLMETE